MFDEHDFPKMSAKSTNDHLMAYEKFQVYHPLKGVQNQSAEVASSRNDGGQGKRSQNTFSE